MALKSVLRRMTLLDRAIVMVLGMFAGSLLLGINSRAPGENILVEREGKIIFTAPLKEEREIRLKGIRGEAVLIVREGGAEMIEAPCPRKVCMGMGRIDQDGEIIACVPNGLLVRIEGGNEPEKTYDVLSR